MDLPQGTSCLMRPRFFDLEKSPILTISSGISRARGGFGWISGKVFLPAMEQLPMELAFSTK